MFRNISRFNNDMTQQRNPVANFLTKSKVINASSNILIYWFVGGAFREHFTKIFQVKTLIITSSTLIIIITIKNNRHQLVQHHHEQYHHHQQHHLQMPSKSTKPRSFQVKTLFCSAAVGLQRSTLQHLN